MIHSFAFALALLLAAGLSATSASAEVVIDWAHIGHTGNTADTTGYGAVAYAYKIGKYEVTNAQYTEFLNAVDPSGVNPNSIYHIGMGERDSRGGIAFDSTAANGAKYTLRTINMGNKPVNIISWFAAARFTNWLHNGQGAGGTETGAYTLDGNTGLPTRNPDATFWLPSWDEWHKAAFYDPNKGGPGVPGYWLYPTQSDVAPTWATATSVGDVKNPGPNVANWGRISNWEGKNFHVTTVGSAQANNYFGTFDMSGNVQEWNDTVIDLSRVVRGGHLNVYHFWPWMMESPSSQTADPNGQYMAVGFRVVSGWTPNTYTVTFDPNSGDSPDPVSKQVTYGNAYGTLATTTLTKYAFNGWFTAATGGTEVTAATLVEIESNQTLHAQWTLIPPAIVTDLNEVSVPEGSTSTFQVKLSDEPVEDITVTVTRSSGDADITVQSGGSLTFTTTNWDTYQTVTLAAAADADADNGTATITCDPGNPAYLAKTVTATEIEKEAVLTIASGGNGTTSPAGAVIVEKAAATAIAATAAAGYDFVNWTVSSGSATLADENAASTTATISAAATVQANFTPNTYNVTFDPNDGTAPAPTSKEVTYDAAYGSLATTTRTGYIFLGWFTAASGGSEVTDVTTVTTASNHTLHAQWLARPIAITRSASPIPAGSIDTITGTTVGNGKSLTYVITNISADDLLLGVVTPSAASNCTVNITSQPADTVAPSASTNLILSVTPTTPGAWQFSLGIPNNGAAENPYSWTVSGNTFTVFIDYVEVGHAGNLADTAGTPGLGAVDYAYRIGTYEVTNAQYVEFLNAADPNGTNPNGIYNTSMGGNARSGIAFTSGNPSGAKYTVKAYMGNKPVNYVSVYDAARFTNWMFNGQGTGSTESGVYNFTLTGNTPATITKPEGATVWLPTVDEWYKAAYFDPNQGGAGVPGYWLYPTQSNTAPTFCTANNTAGSPTKGDITNPGANVANYNNKANWTLRDDGGGALTGNVTTVGSAGANSSFGTYDMAGNVREWTGTATPTFFYILGGSWSNGATGSIGIDSTGYSASFSATTEETTTGFRLASIIPIQTQYEAWANGAAFIEDANGDGISNGLAFLLGADDPDANASGLLPTVEETGGGLVLNFPMRNSSNRGTAALSVEHSSDLGIGDNWLAVAVPEESTIGGPTYGVTFNITPAGPFNIVVATISSSEAANGKLFGRLKAVNP